MKRFQYTFDYTDEEYNTILKTVRFNKSKKEMEIFKLLTQGYTCNQIAEKMDSSWRTIQRRRRTIYNKVLEKTGIDKIDRREKEDLFCVYILIFPNSKVYIGQTINTKNRWGKNGNKYKENEKMYQDICKYGWDNIDKKILYDHLSYQKSIDLEREMIIHYRSNVPIYGYNKDL